MAIQYNKMILHGILQAVLYIALPLVLFEVFSMMGLMTFSQEFKITIIIIGIIGVVFAMLRHAFPKDTSANRLVAFGSVVYSGIYLFYLFGGFTPGVALGTYSINLPTIQVLLGLQLIAWLFLASSGIRALQYLIEAIELRKKKEYNVRIKKQFKLSKLFKVFGSIMGLVIFGYFGSLVYSGMNLGFNIHDSYGVGWDAGLLPMDPSDDTINITMTFDVSNQGLYAIYDVSLDVDIYTVTTANPIILPEYTKIGESLDNYYSTFHSFTVTPDNNITINIDPLYAPGLATTDAVLELQISFSTLYAGILVDLNVSIQTVWNSLI
jgi:MFS family permease